MDGSLEDPLLGTVGFGGAGIGAAEERSRSGQVNRGIRSSKVRTVAPP